MKRLLPIALTSTAMLYFAAAANALVLLDDHFLLGNRTNQNLTSSSAWFANGSGASLTNAVGNMTEVVGTSSSMAMTYFMPPGNPSSLQIGDTIKVTVTFSNIGVSLNGNATTGLRIGLFNYSAGGTRITADGYSTSGGNGDNVQGYCLFMNFGQTNGTANPLSIRKRTTLDANLMGSSGEYTSLAAGGGALGDPGFSNNVVYTMVFSVTRTNTDAVVITNSFTGPNLNMEFDTADTSGSWTNFDCFAMRPANSVGCASNIVFTEFKVEGPPGLLTAPTVTANPQDMTLTVSDFGIFSAAAAGSLPLGFQWYFNNVSSPLANQTNQSLVLTNIQMSQAGQYFIIVTNGQGSATSAVATLTVTTPTPTPRGVVVDDTFQNASRLVSVTPTNSDWVSSVDTTLGQATIPSPLLGFAQTNTSTLWVGNFVDPGAPNPVSLAVGDALRATLVFNPTNPAAQNTGSLRFGIFDFYDGSVVLTYDGNVAPVGFPSYNGNGGGTNSRGYLLTVNFGTSFGDGTPLALFVRNNLGSLSLMGSTADFLSLGSGPSGMSNAPAFLSGSEYTLTITAARMATTLMQVSASVTGPQLSNLGFMATDDTYFTHRFSGFGIRPNRTTDSADTFNMTHFKVEVIPATSAIPSFSITTEGVSSQTNFFVTWPSTAGKFYRVESTPTLSPAAWVTNATVFASGSPTSYTNVNPTSAARFYRVVAPPQP